MKGNPIPVGEVRQKRLLRALMNERPPFPISEEFLEIQDEYLREETAAKGITDIRELAPIEEGIYLWKGDITTLRCGAIVNAANSGMTGCYVPLHRCIDNAIHSAAGIRLRLTCAELMKSQGHEEPTGQAKLTPGFALPCDYVLHTVGPIIDGEVSEQDCDMLASCYRACLRLARAHNIASVAFCCISTGVFHFPKQLATQIAVRTVKEYRGDIEVVFNVFSDADYEIYRNVLG